MPLKNEVIGMNIVLTLQPQVTVNEVMVDGASRPPRRVEPSGLGMDLLYVQYILEGRQLELMEHSPESRSAILDANAQFCAQELQPHLLGVTRQMVMPITAGLTQLGVRFRG